MSDETITKQLPNENQTVPEESDQVERLLSSLEPGWKVSVWRIMPTWCKGYLETLSAQPDQDMDLEYLASEWGGEVLHLKIRDNHGRFRGGSDIDFRSYPPKFHGVPVNRNSVDIAYHTGGVPGRRSETWDEEQRQLQVPQQMIVQQPQTESQSSLLRELMGVVEKVQAGNHQMYAPLLSGPKAISDNPIEQMMQTARAMKEMSELFGQGEQAASGSDETSMFGSIAQIAQMMMSQKQEQPQPQPQPQYLPPRPGPRPGPRPVIRNDTGRAPQPLAAPSGTDPVSMLAALPPEKAADFFINVVQKMQPQQAEQMFGEITSRLGMDSDLDSEYENESTDEPTGAPLPSDSDTTID